MAQSGGTVFKGALLVAGTTIGAGMLGLPVDTAEVGFFPSLLIYLVCWACMAATGLLLLEACLWWKEDKNIVSMAGHTLGRWGRIFSWGWYLFLFYCLTLAYVVGGGNFTREISGGVLSDRVSSLLFVGVFGSFVYIGERLIGRLNVLLMGGLVLSFLAFIFLGFEDVRPELLFRSDWLSVWNSLPIVFIAFAYQGLVPTLARYMQYDVKRTRAAIIYGSVIPLVCYAVWQALILGIVPYEGPDGLLEAKRLGLSAVLPLKHFIQMPYVYYFGLVFAFFAIATSFLGVTLGLLDFLADGLGVEKSPKGRAGLCMLIFVPPLILAELYPHVFLDALGLAGGFGVALLLGALPVVMVWVGRYYTGYAGPKLLPGGRWTLSAILLFLAIEVTIELCHLIHRCG